MEYFDYRTFIKTRVLEVCPEMKEHKDGFNRDNIDSITSDSGFHILPTSINSEFVTSNCDNFEDTLNIGLQLLFCGGRYVADKMDFALSKSHCIRNKLIKRDQFPVDETLLRIEINQINIEPAPTNDNTIIVNLDLTMYLNYCTEC